MPIRYERDDILRLVVVTVQEPFQWDDLLAITARQRADHAWTYGILYDLRGMTSEPNATDVLQLMSQAAVRRPGNGGRVPVALLATDPGVYGQLCTYAALGRSTTLTIGVFRDRPAAERWLAAHAER